LLVDGRQRVLVQTMDLVRGTARQPDRQWLYGQGRMKRDIAAFVREKLGHEPKDLGLFELAFTHSSVRSESYERLEFLGDRVLGIVIAHVLYQRHPNEPE